MSGVKFSAVIEAALEVREKQISQSQHLLRGVWRDNFERELLRTLPGTSIVGAVAMIDPRLAGIVAIGLVVLVAAVAAFLMLRAWARKRKAQSMANELTQHSSTAPAGVNAAAKRARLDAMRRTFGEGLTKFGGADNIYKFPWYLIVGEPGSGKTEAIRHSNVGFPPGLQNEMQGVGGAVKSGSKTLSILLLVVGLAVLREGSEVVLFLYGMAVGGIGAAGLAAGIAVGVCGGATLGFALYFGLLRVPMKHFFMVTNVMLMLLAAGLAAAAAGFLVQSDLLPTLGSRLWDTSRLLSDDSLIGRTLGVLVGYKAAPAGIQVGFYVCTLALLYAGTRWQQRRKS